MPTIVITEAEQALTAARNAEWKTATLTDFDTLYIGGKRLFLTSGGTRHNFLNAEFGADGGFDEARIVESKLVVKPGRGVVNERQSVETTHDWETLLSWIAKRVR